MSAEQLYTWWLIWLAVGGMIVVAAAILLLTIIGLAHRIARLAGVALAAVGDVEANTRAIWELNDTNKVAGDLALAAEAAAANSQAIASALSGDGREPGR